MSKPPPIVVTGPPRSGTTLMYCMLRYAVDPEQYQFHNKERSAQDPGYISKYPRACLHPPKGDVRYICMVRHPYNVVTSVNGVKKYKDKGYFLGPTNSAGNAPFGFARWFEAIQKIWEHPRVMIVPYESLVLAPEAIRNALQHWAGLRYRRHVRFADFWQGEFGEYWEGAMNGKRPLDSGHDWREHMDRVNECLAELPELEQMARTWGYRTV